MRCLKTVPLSFFFQRRDKLHWRTNGSFFWHTTSTSTSLYNYILPLEGIRIKKPIPNSNFCFRIQWLLLGYWISTTLRLTPWNPEAAGRQKIWQILTAWFNFHGSRRWMKALFVTLFSIPSAKSCWATTAIWLNLTPSGSSSWLAESKLYDSQFTLGNNRSKLSSFCLSCTRPYPKLFRVHKKFWNIFFCNSLCMHFEEFSLTKGLQWN